MAIENNILILKLPENVVKVLVEGLYKAKLIRLIDDGKTLRSEVKRVSNYSRAKTTETEKQALIRSVKEIFGVYASYDFPCFCHQF